MMLQTGGALPTSAVELVKTSSAETKVVLLVMAVFSMVSWFIIVLKWWQFRRLNRQANRFFERMERTTRLDQAYQAVMKQPPSPYNRLFREAINFYYELRPGAAPERRGDRATLTPTQLEAFKMVLGKEVAAERDLLGHYIPWLATIGSVSPLLGLLGTVLGIMNAFIGIATKGSGNLAQWRRASRRRWWRRLRAWPRPFPRSSRTTCTSTGCGCSPASSKASPTS